MCRNYIPYILLLCIRQYGLICFKSVLNFNQQVDAREREIQRLNQMLEGGKPEDVINNETRERSNERLVSHLNIQVSNSLQFFMHSRTEMTTLFNQGTGLPPFEIHDGPHRSQAPPTLSFPL